MEVNALPTVAASAAAARSLGYAAAAGGFEPVPVNAGTMPPQVLKALASKESGPPPPKLDAAALAALIASTQPQVPLPDRNPRR